MGWSCTLESTTRAENETETEDNFMVEIWLWLSVLGNYEGGCDIIMVGWNGNRWIGKTLNIKSAGHATCNKNIIFLTD